MDHEVVVFKAYPFKEGQKIRIEDSPRSGDWEVMKVTDHKMTLGCPISKKQIVWSRFCYLVEEKLLPWPQV